jgi:hypothetical protein
MSKPVFLLRVVFHNDTTEEERISFIRSFDDKHKNAVEYISSWCYHHVDWCVRLAFKESKCECHKVDFWDLILFFADSWQEVQIVEIEFDGKKIKVFPLDVGTCS